MYQRIAAGLVSLSLLLLGVSTFLQGSHGSINLVTAFYNVSDLLSESAFANITALWLIVTALVWGLFSLKRFTHRPTLLWLSLITALMPLLTLISPDRYIASLGGFPVLGSGQGIIKYAALVCLALVIALPEQWTQRQKALLNYFPVALVLAWIGGLKFMAFEAKGIEPLVSSSPFMAWLYDVFSLQGASNLIGVYDVIALLLLGIGLFKRVLLPYGVTMAGAVFVVTQTFLVTWDGALSGAHVLTSSGQFIIKDLWFIANLVLIFSLSIDKTEQTDSFV